MTANELVALSTSTCVPVSTGQPALPTLTRFLSVRVRLMASLIDVVLGKENMTRGMAVLLIGPGPSLVTALVTMTFRLKV